MAPDAISNNGPYWWQNQDERDRDVERDWRLAVGDDVLCALWDGVPVAKIDGAAHVPREYDSATYGIG